MGRALRLACLPPSSMGLAGIRTPDNMALFEPKRPLAVVYFDIDYERNPKGQGEGALSRVA